MPFVSLFNLAIRRASLMSTNVTVLLVKDSINQHFNIHLSLLLDNFNHQVFCSISINSQQIYYLKRQLFMLLNPSGIISQRKQQCVRCNSGKLLQFYYKGYHYNTSMPLKGGIPNHLNFKSWKLTLVFCSNIWFSLKQ